jgi:hypothetical protein
MIHAQVWLFKLFATILAQIIISPKNIFSCAGKAHLAAGNIRIQHYYCWEIVAVVDR